MNIFSIIFSGIALLISLTTFIWQFSEYQHRKLKQKIMYYLYQYMSATYIFTSLPTTLEICNALNSNHKIHKNQLIEYALIELSIEGKVTIVTPLDGKLETFHWKPEATFQK